MTPLTRQFSQLRRTIIRHIAGAVHHGRNLQEPVELGYTMATVTGFHVDPDSQRVLINYAPTDESPAECADFTDLNTDDLLQLANLL